MARIRDYQVTVWYTGAEPSFQAIRNTEDAVGEWLEIGLGDHDGKRGWLNVRSNRTPQRFAKYAIESLGLTATEYSPTSK